MHFRPLLLAALVAGTAACTTRDPLLVVPSGATSGAGAVVVTGSADPYRWPQDPITVRGAVIEGDSIVVQAEHGGGCRRHAYALVIGREWAGQDPTRVGALLAHDADGDACEALLSRRLAFSLVPLREAYRRRFGTTGGSIEITITPGGAQLTYAF